MVHVLCRGMVYIGLKKLSKALEFFQHVLHLTLHPCALKHACNISLSSCLSTYVGFNRLQFVFKKALLTETSYSYLIPKNILFNLQNIIFWNLVKNILYRFQVLYLEGAECHNEPRRYLMA